MYLYNNMLHCSGHLLNTYTNSFVYSWLSLTVIECTGMKGKNRIKYRAMYIIILLRRYGYYANHLIGVGR